MALVDALETQLINSRDLAAKLLEALVSELTQPPNCVMLFSYFTIHLSSFPQPASRATAANLLTALVAKLTTH